MLSLTNAYIAVSTAYKWPGADDYCYYHYQSHLATISSSTELEDARIACEGTGASFCWIGLNDYAPPIAMGNYLWIGNDSLNISYTNWKSGDPTYSGYCAVMSSSNASNAEWEDRSCTQSYNFICNDVNTAPPPSNVGYIGVSGVSSSWYEADSYCYYNYQSHLATIKSSSQNNEAANICRNLSVSDSCWIGLSNLDNYWKWINDSSLAQYYNFDRNEPSGYQGYCVYLSTFDSSGRYWMDRTCTGTTAVPSFICNGANTATPPSNVGYIGVYSSTETYTWYDADDLCVSIYESHLATIRSEEENNEASNVCAGLFSGDHDCFIGLNNIGTSSSSQYQWANDSSLFIVGPSGYNNFYYNEPSYTSNAGVFISYGTSSAPRYWFDTSAQNSQKNSFVCNPANTTTTASSVGYFGYKGIDIQIGAPTFFAADDWCYWKNQSHLATIKSDAENNEVIDVCRGLGNEQCWIGLSNIDSNSNYFKWISDGSNANNYYTKWHGTETFLTSEVGTKINVQSAGRYWRTLKAAQTVDNFICDPPYSAVNASSVGYIARGGSYNFYDADDFCLMNHESHLATIKSEAENHEAVNVCRDLNTSWDCWIGLNNLDGTTFRWLQDSSDSNQFYTIWYPGNPSTFNEYGVKINSLGQYGRFWRTQLASNTAPAILCDPPNTAVSPTSLGYVAHRTSDIGAGTYSFQDADDYCSNRYQTHLATIKSEAQNNEVINVCRTVSEGGRCWMGLNYPQSGFNWVWKNDSSRAYYFNWFPGEPTAGISSSYCGVVHSAATGYGRYWTDIICSNTAIESFVCDPPINNINATVSPTKYPTNMPTTINPTNMPITSDPTNMPTTSDPTQSPITNAPTTSQPSDNPTTSDPTISPITNAPITSQPSDIPTITTFNPTTLPTVNPTIWTNTEIVVSGERVKIEIETKKQDLESTFSLVTLILLSVIALIALSSFIDGHYIRKNDYFSIGSVFGAGLQFMDMLSDCFFAINIGIENKYDDEFFPALIASIIFIVMPSILSLLQLFQYSGKHWTKDDTLRTYLAHYSKYLYLLSLLTGSSFTAISLLNSNMFKFDILSMGLSRRQMMKFATKRVYSVILLENLPQLIIQTWYLSVHGGTGDLIAVCSLILSLVSIIVTIMSMVMEKQLINTQQYVILKMNVTGNCVVAKVEQCKTNVNKIKKYICSIIGVLHQTTEIIKPHPIPKGLQLKIYIYINKNEEKTDYVSTLIQATDDGELQTFIKQTWKLESIPQIDNVTSLRFESKKERKETDRTNVAEAIQLTNSTSAL